MAGKRGLVGAKKTANERLPEGLTQLVGLFRASIQADNAHHRAIQQQLTGFNAIPDYNNYLAYILHQMTQEEGQIRQMAGLMLKNNAKNHWSQVHPDVQGCVSPLNTSSAANKHRPALHANSHLFPARCHHTTSPLARLPACPPVHWHTRPPRVGLRAGTCVRRFWGA